MSFTMIFEPSDKTSVAVRAEDASDCSSVFVIDMKRFVMYGWLATDCTAASLKLENLIILFKRDVVDLEDPGCAACPLGAGR